MERVYFTEEIMKGMGLNEGQRSVLVWVIIAVVALVVIVGYTLDKNKREQQAQQQAQRQRQSGSAAPVRMPTPPAVNRVPQPAPSAVQHGRLLDAGSARTLLNDAPQRAECFTKGSLLRLKTSKAGMNDWRVLEVKDGRALLFCVDDMKPAGLVGATPVRWAESECRRVMAELLADFPEAIRAAVLPTTCSNTVFRDGRAEADGATTDHLFALSEEEAVRYYRMGGLAANPDARAWSCVARSASGESGTQAVVLQLVRIPLGFTGTSSCFLQTSKAEAAECSKPTHPAMWVDVEMLLKACAG